MLDVVVTVALFIAEPLSSPLVLSLRALLFVFIRVCACSIPSSPSVPSNACLRARTKHRVCARYLVFFHLRAHVGVLLLCLHTFLFMFLWRLLFIAEALVYFSMDTYAIVCMCLSHIAAFSLARLLSSFFIALACAWCLFVVLSVLCMRAASFRSVSVLPRPSPFALTSHAPPPPSVVCFEGPMLSFSVALVVYMCVCLCPCVLTSAVISVFSFSLCYFSLFLSLSQIVFCAAIDAMPLLTPSRPFLVAARHVSPRTHTRTHTKIERNNLAAYRHMYACISLSLFIYNECIRHGVVTNT